jgi:elongation factor Ts
LSCKEALEEAGGDEEKAIEILRKRGIAQAAKKATRDQAEGCVFIAEEGDKRAAVVLLKCETDFVARDDNFQALGKKIADTVLHKGLDAANTLAQQEVPALVQKLGENITLGDVHLFEHPVVGSYLHSNGKIGVVIGLDGGTRDIARDVAMHAAAMNPAVVRPEEISSELVEKEKEIWSEQLKKEGKPEAIIEKIMLGKEKKFREESALLKQSFAKDPSKTVKQYIGNATVVAYVRVAVG